MLKYFKLVYFCFTLTSVKRLHSFRIVPRHSFSPAASLTSTTRTTSTITPKKILSATMPPIHPSPFKFREIHPARARLVTSPTNAQIDQKKIDNNNSCVVLWMSRDQRVEDNHAFAYAQAASKAHKVPLKVVFNLVPHFLDATLRQYSFMLSGLQEIEGQLRNLGIPFHLLMGDPVKNVPQFLRDNNALLAVTDFSPMRTNTNWVDRVAASCDQGNGSSRSNSSCSGSKSTSSIPLVQVDAHNIVPCWEASDKQEYMAKQMRTKIHAKLAEFTKDLPPAPAVNVNGPVDSLVGCVPTNWKAALDLLEINRDVREVDWVQPGPAAAHRMLGEFIEKRLKTYAESSNNPLKDTTSYLSSYIHFGHISTLRILHTMRALKSHRDSVDSFIEQSVVRKELTDNFCYYNPLYDSLEGAHGWAQDTLRVHSIDKRAYVYTEEQFDQAKTHDELWNAAQRQMLREGRMHGFLRMYWAKKILEWTPSPEEALRISLKLNDKYQLDGRDPNGVVGCMWSICGVHDMGWTERPIFGKIRFMNFDGCKRKFDVASFIARYPAENGKTAGTGRTTKSISSFFKASSSAASTIAKKGASATATATATSGATSGAGAEPVSSATSGAGGKKRKANTDDANPEADVPAAAEAVSTARAVGPSTSSVGQHVTVVDLVSDTDHDTHHTVTRIAKNGKKLKPSSHSIVASSSTVGDDEAVDNRDIDTEANTRGLLPDGDSKWTSGHVKLRDALPDKDHDTHHPAVRHETGTAATGNTRGLMEDGDSKWVDKKKKK